MEKELSDALSGFLQSGDHTKGEDSDPPGGLSLRVDLGTVPLNEQDILARVGEGLLMIQWTCSGSRHQFPGKLLWQISKRGVWNHVNAPALSIDAKNGDTDNKKTLRFILDNPNIVHSFELGHTRSIPRGIRAYGRVAPLPGQPVWSLLPDTASLLSYLHHTSKDEFIRLRWDRKEKRLFSLGEGITYYFQSPRDLPAGFMDEICRMVDAGGSVDITHVRANLEKAYLIGYAMENGVIVGDSSLKHPREVFIRRLKASVGLDFTGFVERGYTSVRPEYRALGVGKKLLEGLTRRAGRYKVFSIIGEDNPATQKIALRNNTRKILVYFSEKLNK